MHMFSDILCTHICVCLWAYGGFKGAPRGQGQTRQAEGDCQNVRGFVLLTWPCSAYGFWPPALVSPERQGSPNSLRVVTGDGLPELLPTGHTQWTSGSQRRRGCVLQGHTSPWQTSKSQFSFGG